MPAPDLVELFVAPLEALEVPYFVTGSVASMAYGEPRLTMDVDVVVDLQADRIQAMRAAFGGDDFYCPPESVFLAEVAREAQGHVNVLHLGSGMKADVYFLGRDPLHLWALALRRRLRVGAVDVWFAPPEYVVLRKLLYYREGGSEKHVRDIRSLLSVQGPAIDRRALEAFVDELGLRAIWAVVSRGL